MATRQYRHIQTQTFDRDCCSIMLCSLDRGLHLAVLHSQQEALMSLTQVVSALTGEEVLNMRNHLHQVMGFSRNHRYL